jgi:hypothetical protein
VSKKKDDEQCEPCNHQIAADMSLSICKTVEGKIDIDCEKLHAKVKAGKIKPLTVAKKIYTAAKKKKLPVTEQLEEIYHMGKNGV